MTASPVQAGSLVGARLGKYNMLALLAVGGTAEIYLARIAGEAGFEKYVVVKCLLDHLADEPDFVRMFLDEARLGAQLDHSNIVQTLELGQHLGRYYMVMEHLAGMSVAQLARKTHERIPGGVMPVEIVLGLAAQACSGLHYAHQRTGTDGKQLNVVHRDVSPQNLVVTFEGVLKIVDFGIAKADQRQTNTKSGTIKGKFAYMSPEQCVADPIDRRTDVFALGTVVHELLTVRRLFKRVNTYETYQAILKGHVPPPSRYNSNVDAALDQVVQKAVAFKKEDRFPTAEAFGEAMLGWLHKRGVSVSASDVSRYVERICAQEVEEHVAHMRQLISGHQVDSTGSLRWGLGGGEAPEESDPLAEPPSARAAAEPDDYDEGGDETTIDPQAEEGDGVGAISGLDSTTGPLTGPTGFRVPGPGSGAGQVGEPGRGGPDAPTAALQAPSSAPRERNLLDSDEGPTAERRADRSPSRGRAPSPPSSSLGVYDTPPGGMPGQAAAANRAPDLATTARDAGPLTDRGSQWAEDSEEVLRQPLSQPGVAAAATRSPIWLLALAFLLAAGVGLGLTLLFGRL